MVYGVVFFTSAAVLGYEIIFTRVFSYSQWHNLSPVIITMALLGSGAAGTAVTLLKGTIEKNYRHSLYAISLCFPLFMAGGFILSAMLPVNPYGINFSTVQLFYMFLYFTLMGLPFLAGSAVICISFLREPPSLAYGINLLGSGVGGAVPLALSYYLHPYSIMSAVIFISLVPAVILACFYRGRKQMLLIVPVAAAVILSGLISSAPGFRRVSEYKPISGALNLPGAKITGEAYSPLSVLQIVESEGLRSTSGLSIISPSEVPVQKILYFDGDSPSPVTPFSGDPGWIDFIRHTASWLPYCMKKETAAGRALIIGAGGGEPLLRALSAGFSSIDAVEVNSSVISVMTGALARFSGNIYLDNKVSLYNDEGRSFSRRSPYKYDLIDIPVLDAFNSAASGVYALNESYLYTVESFRDFYGRLSPGGLLSVTRWITTPPRDSLKMFNTAAESLRSMGMTDPGRRMLAIRSVQTMTLLISESPFSPADIRFAKKFCAERLFDIIYYPGMTSAEADINIRQGRSILYRSFTSLLSDGRDKFIDSYDLDISAPVDNRPYFYNYFKPAFMKYIIRYGPTQVPVTEWGYLLLAIILIPVTVISFLSILFPLIKIKKKEKIKGGKIIPYFSLIAAGFFFIEMPLIQKMILFLGSPVYSLSVIISSLLVFSGMGSLFSDRVFTSRRGIYKCIGAIVSITLLYTFTLDRFFSFFILLPACAKILMVTALIAPLAFFMGIPFPRGLSVLKKDENSSLPLAWGVNGFFSVISILAAAIFAITYGFRAVFITAALFYIAAGAAFPRREGDISGPQNHTGREGV
ncbi:MAG TPA: hypothetical protein PK358_03695 [Spirochaetota bacterium]|nr:hypothetical protein [Spirochaetota bacterium]HPJ33910.1 hypothetical protein [Spirochaetota bacterium]